jgi:hypothetical protein
VGLEGQLDELYGLPLERFTGRPEQREKGLVKVPPGVREFTG